MDAKSFNLSKLAKHFSDETAARELLERMRWPTGPFCPTCGETSTVYRMQKLASSKKPGRPGLLRCRACKKQFTVTTGTVFEDSHIPLSKWILAVHLLCASKKGMSAHQLHRMLGVTYKSAWFMAHRLRYAMSMEPLASKLRGIVEVDETYVGGKRRGTRSGRPGPDQDHKTPVIALVERHGRARAYPMPRVTSEDVQKLLHQHLDQLQTELMTDEAQVYGGAKFGRIPHHTVNHSKDEYVRGNVSTNTVEGFFSLLKRGIIGVYHHVGKGHLHRYCDEFAFRYSARHVSDGERSQEMVTGAIGKRLTYRQPASVGKA